jgi:hypothetical protein
MLRFGSAVSSVVANSASNRLAFQRPAKLPRLARVWWPMPRLGFVAARRNAGSSSLLTMRRSQAQRSRISARSKKLCPPETLYGDAGLAQRLLEHPGLVVSAVQDREVAQLGVARAADRFDVRDRALGLVDLVVALDGAHRIAAAELAPELLLVELRVVADHRIGGAQDAAGRAVVLLQRNHLQRRIVGRQALQVVERRAAPAVDALVVVADGGEHPRLAGDQLHQLVLHAVGVLVLVDQDVAQPLAPRHRAPSASRASSFAGRTIRSSKSTAW